MDPVPTIDPGTDVDTSEALTLYDLARLWGVSYSTIYEQALTNTLPVPVFRVGRRYLVSRKAYEAVMTAHHEPARESA